MYSSIEVCNLHMHLVWMNRVILSPITMVSPNRGCDITLDITFPVNRLTDPVVTSPPSSASFRGHPAADDRLAVSPVLPFPLRKSSASSIPCCHSSCGSLTIPQLLGADHQWDGPRNIMANDL
jgi:hypothetical protein